MPSLPQGYAAADDDPWRGASPFGIAVTMGATRRRWVTGRSPVDGATAALLARRWARCCHSTLLSIVDCGVSDDGTPWFAVPEVEPAGDVSLEELLEVIEAVGQLHADGQNHGALAEALVRDADGRVRVSPPWMGEGGSDHEALADAQRRVVDRLALQTFRGIEFQNAVGTQDVDRTDFGDDVRRDQHDDLVESLLRRDRLRHDFAKPAEQKARSG